MSKNKKSNYIDCTSKTNTITAVAEKPENNQPKNVSVKSPIKKKRKWHKIVIALLIICGIVFLISKLMSNAVKNQDAYYVPQVVTRRDISVSVEGSGTIKPNDSYSVTALVKGEILYAPFNEGDIVEKGDLLYQIEATDVETSISQAKISLESAKLNYNNLMDIVNDLTVTASTNGQITKIHVDPNDNISAGMLLADIVDNSNMLLKVPFHKLDVSKIAVGQTADVYISATGEKLGGTVTEISSIDSTGNGGTLVREVTISVKNPGGIDEKISASAIINKVSCANNGTFSYNSSKSVYAEVSGKVESIKLNEGYTVANGQAIMQLSSTALETQIESAKLSIKSAELVLKSANDALDNYSITAPISGTIVEKNFKTGDTIDATSTSSVLAVIYDMSSLNFKMNIDELDIGKIKVGQNVAITVDALDDEQFTGHVDRININGTTINGVTSYPITIIVEMSDALLPGMNVSSNIVTEHATNVLTIPVSSVSRGNTVIIKSEQLTDAYDNQNDVATASTGLVPGYEKINVTLGRSDGSYVEILSGLNEGDVVYTDTASVSSIIEQMQAMDERPQ